jgi:hypothetical protein
MRANTYWKCVAEGCEDNKVYNFKGLCRSCTTYEDGNVVVAVNSWRSGYGFALWLRQLALQ